MGLFELAREEGILEGKIEGREEQTIAFAKSMLFNGESIDKIILYTGLSRQVIEQLNMNQ